MHGNRYYTRLRCLITYICIKDTPGGRSYLAELQTNYYKLDDEELYEWTGTTQRIMVTPIKIDPLLKILKTNNVAVIQISKMP